MSEQTLSSRTPRELVVAFYERIWDRGDVGAVDELMTEDCAFRGSLGLELRGREAFRGYVHYVRLALSEYHCEIVESVAEDDRVFAKMLFSGIHVADFRGFPATRKRIEWAGAALFHTRHGLIWDVWALGDLAGLDAKLKANQDGSSCGRCTTIS